METQRKVPFTEDGLIDMRAWILGLGDDPLIMGDIVDTLTGGAKLVDEGDTGEVVTLGQSLEQEIACWYEEAMRLWEVALHARNFAKAVIAFGNRLLPHLQAGETKEILNDLEWLYDSQAKLMELTKGNVALTLTEEEIAAEENQPPWPPAPCDCEYCAPMVIKTNESPALDHLSWPGSPRDREYCTTAESKFREAIG